MIGAAATYRMEQHEIPAVHLRTFDTLAKIPAKIHHASEHPSSKARNEEWA
jgi:hypothetical protein